MLKQHQEGRWQSENLEALPEDISKDQVLWVDAQDPTDVEMKDLKDYFSVDEHNLLELNEEGERSRIDEHEDRVFCHLIFLIKMALFLMVKWSG